MKLAISLMGLALVAAAGCQQSKSSNDPTAIDVTTPAPAAIAAPAPAQPVAIPVAETSTPTINASVAAGSSYTIRPGDTLWKIAATHYGNGRKWKDIAAANPGLEPSKLRVGQTITLP